jgi:hypothetical protein
MYPVSTGAAGFIEITSNESLGVGDVWESSGSAENVAAAMSNVSLLALFITLASSEL